MAAPLSRCPGSYLGRLLVLQAYREDWPLCLNTWGHSLWLCSHRVTRGPDCSPRSHPHVHLPHPLPHFEVKFIFTPPHRARPSLTLGHPRHVPSAVSHLEGSEGELREQFDEA